MKELIEFKIDNKYLDFLPSSFETEKDEIISTLRLEKGSEDMVELERIYTLIKKRYKEELFLHSEMWRTYTEEEIGEADFFRVIIQSRFDLTGEGYNTKFDYSNSCNICGYGRVQLGHLELKSSTIPKKDIMFSTAGEVVVSSKFKEAFELSECSGVQFAKTYSHRIESKYFQLIINGNPINLTNKTIAGIHVFDLSDKFETETYKCPNGHTLGLNLLSEAHLYKNSIQGGLDFYASKELIGVKRGLLMPEPLYFCTPRLREMIIKERMKGVIFEVARLE